MMLRVMLDEMISPNIVDELWASGVDMESNYANKIFKRHQLRHEHFHQIQPALEYGKAGIHRNDLVLIHVDHDIFQCQFKVAIKCAANGSELWIKTFHPIGVRDCERLNPPDETRSRFWILKGGGFHLPLSSSRRTPQTFMPLLLHTSPCGRTARTTARRFTALAA